MCPDLGGGLDAAPATAKVLRRLLRPVHGDAPRRVHRFPRGLPRLVRGALLGLHGAGALPRSRDVRNKQLDRGRSMIYLQSERSYRHVEQEEESQRRSSAGSQ